MNITEIVENFIYLEEWDDRYRYLIELGKSLDPLPVSDRTELNRVKGCASQVWVKTDISNISGRRVLTFSGDSDAFIVKGLVALTLALYSGRTPAEIQEIDASMLFQKIGLSEHLTPQRSNGVRSMIERIKRDASAAELSNPITQPS
ncbi:MAG: SufE family protein [Hyphomicrobiales bacterium]